jgi:antitoxin component of RelBE/YafQ-DinJ toxin-antitoxin module
MQTTLRIDDSIYREAKADAANRGITLTRYIEEALKAFRHSPSEEHESPVEQRNRVMEALLQQTAHFRIGEKATREEMNER